jgi:hypothetical protein
MTQGLPIKVDLKPKDIEGLMRSERKSVEKGVNRAIGRTASLGKQIILRRTKTGQGFEGAFDGYSGGYVKALERKGFPTSPVDLFATGQMLNSMQVETLNRRTARIYFSNPEASKKAAFNNRSRPFFGFNDKEEDRLGRFFRKEFNR